MNRLRRGQRSAEAEMSSTSSMLGQICWSRARLGKGEKKRTYGRKPLVRQALLDKTGQELNDLLFDSDLWSRSGNNNILHLILPGLKSGKAGVAAHS